jgi:thymidylate synthase
VRVIVPNVEDVRGLFAEQWEKRRFVVLPNGVKTLELAPISFLANRPTILGAVNEEYVAAELEWYKSQSLFVSDIPGGPPKIWKDVADKDGKINSNYGWMIYSDENGRQYANVLAELRRDPSSRRGVMIYVRPSMHTDYCANGMRDFVCTTHVQYMIRDGVLLTHVSMRSNDAVFGYRNDYHWQKYVQEELARDLGIKPGPMHWTAGSLHFYERHFYMVDAYCRTGRVNVTPQEYQAMTCEATTPL